MGVIHVGDALLLGDAIGWGFGVVQHIGQDGMAIVEMQSRALGRVPVIAVEKGIALLKNSAQEVPIR